MEGQRNWWPLLLGVGALVGGVAWFASRAQAQPQWLAMRLAVEDGQMYRLELAAAPDAASAIAAGAQIATARRTDVVTLVIGPNNSIPVMWDEEGDATENPDQIAAFVAMAASQFGVAFTQEGLMAIPAVPVGK